MLPEAFLSRLKIQLGDEYDDYLRSLDRPRAVALRFNPLKTDTFPQLPFVQEQVPWAKYGHYYTPDARPGLHVWHEAGLYYLQEASAMAPVTLLEPQPGETVLDLCAAPGGKSFTMAELMQNTGSITALDIHEHRVKLIEQGAKRLGIGIITPAQADATNLPDKSGNFDAILCDVPCSGLGVIRRKPEIKYKPAEEFATLPQLQFDILTNAAKHLKSGGRLLYSTCTLRIAENEAVVHSFTEQNPEFSIKYEHTFMPHIDGTDGFYCALITKA